LRRRARSRRRAGVGVGRVALLEGHLSEGLGGIDVAVHDVDAGALGGLLKAMHGVSEALERDFGAHPTGSCAFLRSDTVQEPGRVGLTAVKALKLEHDKCLSIK